MIGWSTPRGEGACHGARDAHDEMRAVAARGPTSERSGAGVAYLAGTERAVRERQDYVARSRPPHMAFILRDLTFSKPNQ